jgi:chromosomal replication initiator protein
MKYNYFAIPGLIKTIRNVKKLDLGIDKDITIYNITKIVFDYFNTPMSLLYSNNGKREAIKPKQVSMFFARESKKPKKYTFKYIGSQMGGYSHSYVMHACKTVNNLIDTDRTFKQDIKNIKKSLKL